MADKFFKPFGVRFPALCLALFLLGCGSPSDGADPPAADAPSAETKTPNAETAASDDAKTAEEAPSSTQAEPKTPAPNPIDEAEAQRRAEANKAGKVRGVVKNSWWNQATIYEDLKLRPEQRERMDDAARDYLYRLWDAQALHEELSRAFFAAAAGGDLEAARRAIEENSENGAYLNTGYEQMALTVLETLEDEQYAAMQERYGHILGRRWIRHMQMNKSLRPRGGG